MRSIKKIIKYGLLCALCLMSFTMVSSAAVSIPSETDPFVEDFYVAPTDQEAPFIDEVLPEIEKNIEKNNKHSISPYYDKFPEANNLENFQGLGHTTYSNINGKTVTAEAFYRVQNEALNDPNNGMGLLIYQAIRYKQAHPEEDVKVTFTSYRTSAAAAVCVIPESKYYGYMRSLYGTNYDEHGFVRISYLMTEAARMGIEVTLVNQLNSYGKNQWNPNTGKLQKRANLDMKTYFEEAMKTDCYNKYAPGKKVSDFMNCANVDWTVTEITQNMQHTKSASASHYLATDGTEHTNAIFLSSSNFDENDYKGRNGNNGAQSGIIITNHDELYRVLYNYTQLMTEYKDQEGIYELRDLMKKLNKEQKALIESGRENEIPKDEQILYLGTENDSVFQLWFTPFAGGIDTWDPENHPFCKYLDKLTESEDYIEFVYNLCQMSNCNLSNMISEKLEEAFCENPNVNNKISMRAPTALNTSAIKELNLGSEIGYRSIANWTGHHCKDMMMSYVENGVRHNVSILTSCNLYPIAFYTRTNSMLVIDETEATDGDFYHLMGEKFFYGMIDNDLMVNPANLSLNQGDSYSLEVDYAHSKKLTWTSSDKSVATVNSKGKVTAIQPGTATITVTDGTYKDSVSLNVMKCVACYDKDGGQTFNTDEQFILSQKYPKLPLTFEATFSVKKSTLKSTTTLLGSDDGYDPALIFALNKSGQPKVTVRNAKRDSAKTYTFKEVNVATGEKVHLSIVMDFTNKKMHCYVNGELKQTLTGITAVSNFEDKYYPVIGGDHRNGNATYFTGEIYSIALWSDKRSAKEIANDYANGFTKHDENLMAHYDLTLCEECMLTDQSNNGLNLEHLPLWLDEDEVSPVGDYEYTFAIVGDTQTMCELDPEAMESLYDWIVSNKVSKKIKYVLGLGDITDNSTDTEWNNANEFIAKLNGEIPYSLARGNHDDLDDFNRNLTNGFYENTVDGLMKEGDLTNSYRYFSIQGKDYLIMTLDFAPSGAVLEWANKVIKQHPNHKVIITTHAYMYRDGTTMDDEDLYPPTHYTGYTDAQNGDDMWEKCFSKHKNVLMVISGHDPWQHIVYRQDKGANGNYVTQMLVDPQYVDAYNGSVAMVALMHFSNDGNTITMRYYSVEKDCFGSPLSQFTIDLNEHKHTDKTTFTPATLTNNGKAVTKCTTCDEVIHTSTIYSPKTFSFSTSNYTYDGKQKTPAVIVKDANGNTLVKNQDYIVSYESGRTKPGKYTAKLIFKGKYSGLKRIYFNIKPNKPTGIKANCKTIDLTLSWKASIRANGYEVYQYDASTKKYKLVGTTSATSLKVTNLEGSTEYKFKIRAYIEDEGTIKSDYSAVFTTKTKRPEKVSSYKLSATNLTYNGKVRKPSVTVKDSKGNKLKKDVDYTISYEKGCKLPGKYSVKITCKGNYTGTKSLTFKIKPAATKKVTIKQTTSKITLTWTKVEGADGYRVYQYNSKTKKYKRIAETKRAKYSVKKLKAGTNYKFKVRAYAEDDGIILGKLSDVVSTATKTTKTSIIEIKSSKKGKVTLSWKNVSGETGYQVYYSTKRYSGYEKAATYKKNITKGAKSKLKSGKTYYFKVRSYKKTASGNVYSTWSAPKRIKVK